MSSSSLPRDRDDLATWLAQALDDAQPRPNGRAWKNALLEGASVHKLMATVPRDRQYHFRVTTEEAMVLSKVLATTTLNRNAFMRRALANWLIVHEGIDRRLIPRLAKDLP